MARLVRARVKRVEEWPESICRCAAAVRRQGKIITVDLSDCATTGHCLWCGSPHTKEVGARNINTGNIVALGKLDLDEGEYTVGPEV